MLRNRAYYRWQRNRTINRKLGILIRIGGTDYVEGWTRGEPGRLSKSKIHCSCGMCREKSHDHLTHRDVKLILAARQQMEFMPN